MIELTKTGKGWWTGSREFRCILFKSTVKIFDIYTEESEYIQAAKGEDEPLSSVRGTFGTADTPPIPMHSLRPTLLFCPFITVASKSS